jgi:hypothetical protein
VKVSAGPPGPAWPAASAMRGRRAAYVNVLRVVGGQVPSRAAPACFFSVLWKSRLSKTEKKSAGAARLPAARLSCGESTAA